MCSPARFLTCAPLLMRGSRAGNSEAWHTAGRPTWRFCEPEAQELSGPVAPLGVLGLWFPWSSLNGTNPFLQLGRATVSLRMCLLSLPAYHTVRPFSRVNNADPAGVFGGVGAFRRTAEAGTPTAGGANGRVSLFQADGPVGACRRVAVRSNGQGRLPPVRRGWIG